MIERATTACYATIPQGLSSCLNLMECSRGIAKVSVNSVNQMQGLLDVALKHQHTIVESAAKADLLTLWFFKGLRLIKAPTRDTLVSWFFGASSFVFFAERESAKQKKQKRAK